MPLASNPLPPGKLRQIITFLEMTTPPADAWVHAPATAATIEPEATPLPADYRALYRAVGERWLWWERLVLSDAALAAILDDPLVEIRLLRIGGDVAGFSEIDRRAGEDAVEIAFLGLKPAFVGKGLGAVLLSATVRAAWQGPTRRVWLHTCNHDHPRALALYRAAGFCPVRVETILIDDPRPRGLLPRSAAPHVPLTSGV